MKHTVVKKIVILSIFVATLLLLSLTCSAKAYPKGSSYHLGDLNNLLQEVEKSLGTLEFRRPSVHPFETAQELERASRNDPFSNFDSSTYKFDRIHETLQRLSVSKEKLSPDIEHYVNQYKRSSSFNKFHPHCHRVKHGAKISYDSMGRVVSIEKHFSEDKKNTRSFSEDETPKETSPYFTEYKYDLNVMDGVLMTDGEDSILSVECLSPSFISMTVRKDPSAKKQSYIKWIPGTRFGVGKRKLTCNPENTNVPETEEMSIWMAKTREILSESEDTIVLKYQVIPIRFPELFQDGYIRMNHNPPPLPEEEREAGRDTFGELHTVTNETLSNAHSSQNPRRYRWLDLNSRFSFSNSFNYDPINRRAQEDTLTYTMTSGQNNVEMKCFDCYVHFSLGFQFLFTMNWFSIERFRISLSTSTRMNFDILLHFKTWSSTVALEEDLPTFIKYGRIVPVILGSVGFQIKGHMTAMAELNIDMLDVYARSKFSWRSNMEAGVEYSAISGMKMIRNHDGSRPSLPIPSLAIGEEGVFDANVTVSIFPRISLDAGFVLSIHLHADLIPYVKVRFSNIGAAKQSGCEGIYVNNYMGLMIRLGISDTGIKIKRPVSWFLGTNHLVLANTKYNQQINLIEREIPCFSYCGHCIPISTKEDITKRTYAPQGLEQGLSVQKNINLKHKRKINVYAVFKDNGSTSYYYTVRLFVNGNPKVEVNRNMPQSGIVLSATIDIVPFVDVIKMQLIYNGGVYLSYSSIDIVTDVETSHPLSRTETRETSSFGGWRYYMTATFSSPESFGKEATILPVNKEIETRSELNPKQCVWYVIPESMTTLLGNRHQQIYVYSTGSTTWYASKTHDNPRKDPYGLRNINALSGNSKTYLTMCATTSTINTFGISIVYENYHLPRTMSPLIQIEKDQIFDGRLYNFGSSHVLHNSLNLVYSKSDRCLSVLGEFYEKDDIATVEAYNRDRTQVNEEENSVSSDSDEDSISSLGRLLFDQEAQYPIMVERYACGENLLHISLKLRAKTTNSKLRAFAKPFSRASIGNLVRSDMHSESLTMFRIPQEISIRTIHTIYVMSVSATSNINQSPEICIYTGTIINDHAVEKKCQSSLINGISTIKFDPSEEILNKGDRFFMVRRNTQSLVGAFPVISLFSGTESDPVLSKNKTHFVISENDLLEGSDISLSVRSFDDQWKSSICRDCSYVLEVYSLGKGASGNSIELLMMGQNVESSRLISEQVFSNKTVTFDSSVIAQKCGVASSEIHRCNVVVRIIPIHPVETYIAVTPFVVKKMDTLEEGEIEFNVTEYSNRMFKFNFAREMGGYSVSLRTLKSDGLIEILTIQSLNKLFQHDASSLMAVMVRNETVRAGQRMRQDSQVRHILSVQNEQSDDAAIMVRAVGSSTNPVALKVKQLPIPQIEMILHPLESPEVLPETDGYFDLLKFDTKGFFLEYRIRTTEHKWKLDTIESLQYLKELLIQTISTNQAWNDIIRPRILGSLDNFDSNSTQTPTFILMDPFRLLIPIALEESEIPFSSVMSVSSIHPNILTTGDERSVILNNVSMIVRKSEKCLPGFKSISSTGRDPCEPCPSGTISPHLGSSNCSTCPENQYPSENKISCLQCVSGTYSNPGDAKCSLCPPGYGSNDEKPGCSPCGPGTYSDETGICRLCEPGSYSSQNANPTCTPCSSGTHSPNYGSHNCLLCAEGTHQLFPGRDNCQPCHYGTYQDQRGSTECLSCPKGTESTRSTASHSCTPCGPGYFNGQEESYCKKCEHGSYTNETSSSTCIQCPEGFTTKEKGATQCDPISSTGSDPTDAPKNSTTNPNIGRSDASPGQRSTLKLIITSIVVAVAFLLMV